MNPVDGNYPELPGLAEQLLVSGRPIFPRRAAIPDDNDTSFHLLNRNSNRQRSKKLQMLQIYLRYFYQLVLIFGPFWVIFGLFGQFWVIFGLFWVILGHFWAILGNFWAILGHFGSFSGHFFGVNFFWPKIYLCYFYYFLHLWDNVL